MHQSRPYGLHSIGLPLTDKDEAFVSNIAARITNLQALSGVDSMKMVYDLPDGGYVVVQDMGGNFRVISHKPIQGEDIISTGIETDYIPILFSGTITKAVVNDHEPVGLRLTEQARRRLTNYDPNKNKPGKDIELQRFRVNYNNIVSEFKPRFMTKILRTQYTQQRPTWYSGAMAEVMQIVGGYGRQDFANLPDETINEFERAQFLLPKKWQDKLNHELLGLRLPAYSGLPPIDGSFQFDYKFNNTNAIGFDERSRPWLLRVNPSGVYAMPMPIVPATRTNAFKEYMQEVGDDEILAILDRFGGMPSGESFPEARYFEAWRRAGVVIKICDVADFYSHIAYSSACGWSLNSRGSEGYNTCYDYYDDEGLGYGLTYKLSLKLVSTDQHYGAEPVEVIKDGPMSDVIQKYLEGLVPTLNSSNNDDKAILYKLRRSKPSDIYQRALGRNGNEDRDYWHNLEMKPIAEHTGSVREVYRGYLYHGAKFQYQPQIKFPEPLVGACVSHDFLPLINGRYKNKYPNSDTIMFAYYVEDNLKVVKYFVNWDSFQRKTESNYEPYMTVGSWQETEYSGQSGIQGYFYSSDIDDRRVVSPTTTVTTIVGEDKGYDTKPFFAFDTINSKSGTMWRNRYYTHKTESVTTSDETVSLAACIPYLCRNAALQVRKTSGYNMSYESYGLYAIKDPYSYSFWTYDFVFAWSFMSIKNPKGSPYPKDGNPVWVEELFYNPSPANNFADSGDWVGGLPADYTWLIHPKSNEWINSGGGGPPVIDKYSKSTPAKIKETGAINLSMGEFPNMVALSIPDARYYMGSPNNTGDFFYRDGCQVVFGETTYYNVSEPSAKDPRAKWGYTRLVDNKSAHHFIGVINE